MLSLAEGEEINKTELTYFQALNHLKLENFDQALEEFIYVREENDESLSGIAAFFAGYISFQKQKYKEARNHFEFSLDHTRDVNLDKQAEGFLEEMDRVELFESKAKEKLRYSFVTGFGYDQNVLNVVNQDAATDIDAVRFNYGGSLIYRFKYDYKNEWSGEFNFFDTYSLTNQFKPDSTVQSADPLILSFGLPFHRQGTIGERPVVWGMNPSYQIISMSLDGGPRKQILNSFLTKFDLNFLLNSLWLSSYRFEYSMDQSGVTAASAENELSGVKLNLGMTQTRLLDTRGMQSLNYSLDLSQNQAKGDNYYYNKWTAGVGFNDKLPRDFDGSLKLDYSYQDYPKASEARSDQLISLMGSVSKEILPPIIFNFSLQYNISASDVSAYNYNKYLFNFSLTYSGSKSK
jgi:hypothetical protein